ncbi:MAG: hypothetical protein EAZ74_00865 [Alphaproteobacteria bacterium]|nr:MAG: hypothetical protein EAY76_01920 [Alphaproteobacteria bacterium]TAF15857.1 MAG: hypothetical protein EAZ74_00865 [Alphaproteobacteria bacterium]TAF41112.1 MAG: hypothetical protein EAZ66_01815 [Alphaproteobacteria bacterium]TAF77245.1 MAG: hypothetical protein EAZ52_01550 [Alphaproteobacteria bacterium]
MFSKISSDTSYITNHSLRDYVLKNLSLPPHFVPRDELPDPADIPVLFAYLGYFVVSDDRTWQGYLADVMRYDLGYSPQKYRWFDAVIADIATENVPSLQDANSTLCINIMVIRNLIAHHMFAAPFTDKKTLEQALLTYAHTAMQLGLMLRTTPPSMIEAYHNDAQGCALLYHHLMHACHRAKEQQVGFIRGLFKSTQPTILYDLPSWDNTPFASLMSEPPAATISPILPQSISPLWEQLQETTQNLVRAMQHEPAPTPVAPQKTEEDASHAQRSTPTADELLDAVITLADEIKEEAVEIARDILNKLRLHYADMPLDQMLSAGDLPMIKELTDGMQKVADTFRHHASYALRADPSLAEHSLVSEAQAVLGVFSYIKAQQEMQRLQAFFITVQQQGKLKLLTHIKADIERKRKEIHMMPQEWKQSIYLQQPIGVMLDKVEKGLNTVVTRMQEQTRQDTMLPTNPFQMRTPPSAMQRDLNNDGVIDASEQQQAEAEKAAKQQAQMQAAQQQQRQQNATSRRTANAPQQDQNQQKKQAQDKQRQASRDIAAQEMLQAARQRREAERQQRQALRQGSQQREQDDTSRTRDRASQRTRQQTRQHIIAAQQREQQRREQQRIDREQEQMDHGKQNSMAKLLDADSLKNIHNSLKGAQGKGDVPTSLQPNSPARTAKEITEKRTGTSQKPAIAFDETKQDPQVLVPSVHPTSPSKNKLTR